MEFLVYYFIIHTINETGQESICIRYVSDNLETNELCIGVYDVSVYILCSRHKRNHNLKYAIIEL